MLSPHAEAFERLYAAVAIDDRSVLDPLLGSQVDDSADTSDEVCTGFAGTIRFLRFVSGRFTPRITLEQISECGTAIEVRGRLRMRAAFDGHEVEFPFTHQHKL